MMVRKQIISGFLACALSVLHANVDALVPTSRLVRGPFAKDVPESLQDKNVFYVRCPRQQVDGWSCGYRALACALAVSKFLCSNKTQEDLKQLLQDEVPFLEMFRTTFPKVMRESRNHMERVTDGFGAPDAPVPTFCDEDKLDLFVFERDYTYLFDQGAFSGDLGWHNAFIVREEVGGIRDASQKYAVMNTRLALMRPNEGTYAVATATVADHVKKNNATHFICNLGNGHWVLVSIVTLFDKPTMLVFDSMNSPISEGSRLKGYIDYIYKNYMSDAPQDPKLKDFFYYDRWSLLSKMALYSVVTAGVLTVAYYADKKWNKKRGIRAIKRRLLKARALLYDEDYDLLLADLEEQWREEDAIEEERKNEEKRKKGNYVRGNKFLSFLKGAKGSS